MSYTQRSQPLSQQSKGNGFDGGLGGGSGAVARRNGGGIGDSPCPVMTMSPSGLPRSGRYHDGSTLHQNLARLHQEEVDFPLGPGIDHRFRTHAAWAREAWGGAEQATDQRPFTVHRTAMLAQVRTTEFGEGGIANGVALDRQPGHLFGGRGDRAATIVATRHAGE